MDRMFVGAAPAVTTSPKNYSTGDRSPDVMLCMTSGTARAALLRFPVAQAARWRRRGEPVQRGRACRFMTSSKGSSCT
jgi:hypothetical protein